MLCMGIGGQFLAQAAAIKPMKSKHAHKHVSTSSDSSSSNRNIECSNCEYTSITRKDFHSHGETKKTYLIDRPGKYRLSQSIEFMPNKIGSVAILIDADDVILDLCNNELTQANSTMLGVGIRVKKGNTNVSIVNGTVSNFTLNGIYVEGGSSNIFLGNDDSNLFVKGCGYGNQYSFFDNINGVFHYSCGILLGEGGDMFTYGPIKTIRLSNVFAEENGFCGVFMGPFQDAVFTDCSFSRNIDGRLGYVLPSDPTNTFYNSVFASGFTFFTAYSGSFADYISNSATFINCHFDQNTAKNGPEQWNTGFFFNRNFNGLKVYQCTFNGNQGIGGRKIGLSGFGTAGAILGGGGSAVFEDSEFSGNLSEFFAEGLHHSGNSPRGGAFQDPNGVVIRGCTAAGNRSRGTTTDNGTTSSTARGFELDFVFNLTIEDCVSQNNTATSTFPIYVESSGISLYAANLEGGNGNEKNVLIKGCHISGNSSVSPRSGTGIFNSGDAFGINLGGSPVYNVAIQDCVIQNNVLVDTDGNNLEADIGIFNLHYTPDSLLNLLVEDCKIFDQSFGISSWNFGAKVSGIIQKNTLSNTGTGVSFLGGHCFSVNNNYITNSDVGFLDSNNPSSSLFSNNMTLGVTTPFSVTYAFGPVPVVTGSLTIGFPFGAQALDNIAMDNPDCLVEPVEAAYSAEMNQLLARVKKNNPYFN